MAVINRLERVDRICPATMLPLHRLLARDVAFVPLFDRVEGVSNKRCKVCKLRYLESTILSELPKAGSRISAVMHQKFVVYITTGSGGYLDHGHATRRNIRCT